MKNFRKCVGHEMTWVQRLTLVVPEYELRVHQETVATLRFRSVFGSLAKAESADGCWSFKRVGFFRTGVTVRTCGTDNDIAVFKNDWCSYGGTIEQIGGSSFRAGQKFLSSRYEISNGAGDSLIHYETRFISSKKVIAIQPAAAEMDELPWLVLFGWYLMVMLSSDDDCAAADAAC